MLKTTSQPFRKIFILNFTNELIKNSLGEVDELENVLDTEDKEDKELNKKIKTYFKYQDELSLKDYLKSKKIEEEYFVRRNPIFNIAPISSSPLKIYHQMKTNALPRFLRIPEPRLPSRLSYLKPIPTNKQIDLGKLNILIRDFNVKIIQCNGPEEKIMVIGSMGTKPTSISLTKDEINSVIKKFSDDSKIPIEEGSNRIVAGRLVLLALVSNVVDPRFTIKKISPFPNPPVIR